MDNQERQDLSKIRHYKGTVADFKSYWDEIAGKNTNAYDTPEYQGFDGVHPTRGSKQSPHWKTSIQHSYRDCAYLYVHGCRYNEINEYQFSSTPWTDNDFNKVGHFTQVSRLITHCMCSV